MLIGTFNRYWLFAAFASTALVLSADLHPVAVPADDDRPGHATATSGSRDLVPREIVVVAPLIALLLVLGVYPKPVLDVINPAVEPHADHHQTSTDPGDRTDRRKDRADD